MTLVMHDGCFACGTPLDRTAVAYICVRECTYCLSCTLKAGATCLRDGLELTRRPRECRGGSGTTTSASLLPEFPGVAITVLPDLCVVRSDSPLVMLSSAVVGGGYSRVRVVLNATVRRDYDGSDPAADLRERAVRAGIAEPFVGMMTGVPATDACFEVLQDHELIVGALITAGVRDPFAAGVTPPATLRPGTINLIVFVNGVLDQSALVNAACTATEAKVALLHERGVRTAHGVLATGTATDAVVIAATEQGPRLPYAGPATPVGYLIARCVRACLTSALEREPDAASSERAQAGN